MIVCFSHWIFICSLNTFWIFNAFLCYILFIFTILLYSSSYFFSCHRLSFVLFLCYLSLYTILLSSSLISFSPLSSFLLRSCCQVLSFVLSPKLYFSLSPLPFYTLFSTPLLALVSLVPSLLGLQTRILDLPLLSLKNKIKLEVVFSYLLFFFSLPLYFFLLLPLQC